MAVLRAHAHDVSQRLSRILIVAVMAAVAIVVFGAPSRAADQTWNDVATTINGLLDEGVTTFKSGDAKGGKDKVNEAYYKHYEITGMEKQVMARVSGSRVSQVEVEFSLLKKAMTDGDAAEVDSHAKTLKQYMLEDAASLDGVAPGAGTQASSNDYSPGPWGEVAKTINGILEEGVEAFKSGDAKGGKDKVNEAYYKHYEITGMEKQVMSRVSGSRVSQVEMEFSLLKKAMTDGDSTAVDEHYATLSNLIREDANTLDGYTGQTSASGSSTSPWIAQFLPSLLVILREGMEAILVVAAVLAYLAKAGHKKKTPVVWGGVALALVLSVGLAFLFSYVTSLAGANQELLEGFAALFAVVMLIWVSNWMINKSSNKAWDQYIKKQTDASLTSGSLLGLAFISFLAVLREGAETMLFYVPIVAAAGDNVRYVWIGLAVGLVILVVIYLLIQFAAVRIPLRPFFTVTSLLMAFMAVTFAGAGIAELQEADVVSLTPVSGFPTLDLLGIYPRVENLAAQAIVLVVIVGLYLFGKARLSREAAAQSRAKE
ncbi:Ferrous iron uptake protein [Schaalia odontolytica]|uniref:Ferrous iron uptake protein n=2 Tax=Schaalia odontolytica TaxID=1660 RepID=A0A2X0VQ57_9ACTO|nr:Ferrous iron uptake protein [Schaalia odontolytica]